MNLNTSEPQKWLMCMRWEKLHLAELHVSIVRSCICPEYQSRQGNQRAQTWLWPWFQSPWGNFYKYGFQGPFLSLLKWNIQGTELEVCLSTSSPGGSNDHWQNEVSLTPELKRFAQSDALGQVQGCLIAQLQGVRFIPYPTQSALIRGNTRMQTHASDIVQSPFWSMTSASGFHWICIYTRMLWTQNIYPSAHETLSLSLCPFRIGFHSSSTPGPQE